LLIKRGSDAGLILSFERISDFRSFSMNRKGYFACGSIPSLMPCPVL
jgi:hypothetical protein